MSEGRDEVPLHLELVVLANWRGNDFVRINHTKKELDDLAVGLSRLTASRGAAEIRWGVRQIAIERIPSA